MSTGGGYAGRTDVITLHGQCAAPLEACEASQARTFCHGSPTRRIEGDEGGPKIVRCRGCGSESSVLFGSLTHFH